jgi:anti-sigma factor RsiW
MYGIRAYYETEMTDPLADRLLDALGDSTTRAVLRSLLHEPVTQAELPAVTRCNQSTASRTAALLRALGLVGDEDTGGRSPTLRVEAREELVAVLLAADRLAESILERQAAAQRTRSRQTRRLNVRSADKGSSGEGTA